MKALANKRRAFTSVTGDVRYGTLDSEAAAPYRQQILFNGEGTSAAEFHLLLDADRGNRGYAFSHSGRGRDDGLYSEDEDAQGAARRTEKEEEVRAELSGIYLTSVGHPPHHGDTDRQ